MWELTFAKRLEKYSLCEIRVLAPLPAEGIYICIYIYTYIYIYIYVYTLLAQSRGGDKTPEYGPLYLTAKIISR